MEKADINEIRKSSDEKTDKVYSAIKDGNNYDEIEDDIEFIFNCAFDKRKAVWDYCVINMYKLAEISSNIREKIIKIMETGDAQERFIITCALEHRLDIEFLKEILYRAIRDKSKKVKIFGAQRIDDLSIYEFAEIIKEEMEKTGDNKVKKYLQENYIFLTKGYILEEGKNYKKEISRNIYIAHGYGDRIPDELTTEEEIHEYVITKHKNNDRIKDLYYKK
jgi:hypothetical protein